MRDPQANRDLRWLVGSAPLLRGVERTLAPPLVPIIWPDHAWYREHLRALDCRLAREGEPVTTRFQKRLGRYAERLVEQWLARASCFDLIAANVPIRDASRRTLGEMDMLVRGPAGVEHWEIAVKFYLRLDNPTLAPLTVDSQRWPYWVGVDPSDRLDLKYRRLCEHQLRLMRFEQTREWLTASGIEVSAARAIVKGRLFNRLRLLEGQEPIELALRRVCGNDVMPDAIALDHECGWWMSVADFNANFSANDRGGRFVELSRESWLAPVSARLQTLDVRTLVAQVIERAGISAVHIAHVSPQGNELSRGFVVNDGWLKCAETTVQKSLKGG